MTRRAALWLALLVAVPPAPLGQAALLAAATREAPTQGEATPAEAPQETSAPATTPTAPEPVALPEALRRFAADPFGNRHLLAHRLRGLRGDVAGLILGPQRHGPIAIEALATPLPADGDRMLVPLFVEIDGATFLEHNEGDLARLEVYAYALDATQAVAGFLSDVFVVDVAELGEAIWQSGIKYYGRLELPAGEYALRVVVRNFKGGAFGRDLLRLAPPAATGPVGPLFPLPEARDPWIAVRASGPEAPFPFLASAGAVDACARPVLIPGRRYRAFLFATDPAGLALTGKASFERAGGGAKTARVDALAPPSAVAEGLGHVALELEMPRLDPGEYVLKIELQDAAGAPRSSAGAEVLVVPSQTRERDLIWTDLRWKLPEADSLAAAEGLRDSPRERPRGRKQRRAERKKSDRLVEAYRKVLAGLTGPPTATDRAALLDLESSVLTGDDVHAVDSLRRAELTVIRDLAEADPESLLPVLILHHRLFLDYRGRRIYSLITHSRRQVELLAELYARETGSGELPADALASLAGELQRSYLTASSIRLFGRSLVHDSDHPAALLGLATTFEKYGHYAKAMEYLDLLVQHRPEMSEAKLRLAVNQRRVGLGKRAQETLRELLGSAGPAWIRSVACEEQARDLLEAGDAAGAAELLEAAIDREGDRPGLLVLLAHAYDLMRRPYDSLAAIRRMAAAGVRLEGARKVYDSWPTEALATARHRLDEAASSRIPALARALEASDTRGG